MARMTSERTARKGIWRIMLIALGVVLFALLVVGGRYVYNNLHYYQAPLRRTMSAGFREQQVTLPDGTVLNYAEGPAGGPPLLLIHGQGTAWENYAKVLPELSEHYHIYAVDCHGHGSSSHDPAKYSARAMGEDFAWFIEQVIGEPAVVSGHSSGGLLTAWLAANSPKNVRGVVLEDPPFFTTLSDRAEQTFAWVDSFRPAHAFLQQTEQTDYTLHYLENSLWVSYFGGGREPLLKYAASYRAKHPGQPLQFFFLPPSINTLLLHMDEYDPRFGDTFYDCSWNAGFDHAAALASIKLPSVLIHTNWSYDKNGILLAAMSGDDAARAHALIEGNELIKVDSGHGFHDEKPQQFIQIMVDFLEKVR